jgi:hypothetical protein
LSATALYRSTHQTNENTHPSGWMLINKTPLI